MCCFFFCPVLRPSGACCLPIFLISAITKCQKNKLPKKKNAQRKYYAPPKKQTFKKKNRSFKIKIVQKKESFKKKIALKTKTAQKKKIPTQNQCKTKP